MEMQAEAAMKQAEAAMRQAEAVEKGAKAIDRLAYGLINGTISMGVRVNRW
jgi:hypothetical protein